MNITDTNTQSDISYSDNSHIFGRPIRIWDGVSGSMDIPVITKITRDTQGLRVIETNRDALSEWIKKVRFLEEADIEMHLHFVEPLI